MKFKSCVINTCAKTNNVLLVPFVKPWVNFTRSKEWAEFCGISMDDITVDTVICEKHFRPHSILQPRANPLLMPTIFDWLHDDDDDFDKIVLPTKKTYITKRRSAPIVIEVPVGIEVAHDEDINKAASPMKKKYPKKVSVLSSKTTKCSCKAEGARKRDQISQFILRNSKCAYFYTGLTEEQRQVLFDFLGPAKRKLSIFGFQNKLSRKMKNISILSQFLMTLYILRRNRLFTGIAHDFEISRILVSRVFVTWLQFMFYKFMDIRQQMFVKKCDIPKPLPRHFQNPICRETRVVIDCTELFIENAENFKQQSNTYSRYKSHTTAKLLLGVAPSGVVLITGKSFTGNYR
jgi:hypothetical protein